MSDKDNRGEFSVVLSQNEGGQLAYTQPKFKTIEELAFFLEASARAGTAVVTGKPGRMPPGAKASALAYVDFSTFDRVIEHERFDQVINVETGITIGALQSFLKKHQQWWPVYASPEATLQDVLNSGYGGPIEHRFGAVREIVLGMSVMLADGRSIKCGGRVVKNVTGYDIGKLFIGSQGSLGIPRSAYLRLFALPQDSATLLLCSDSTEEVFAVLQALRLSDLPLSCLEVLSFALVDKLLPKTVQSSKLVLAVQAHGMPEVVNEILNSVQTGQGVGAQVSWQSLKWEKLTGRKEEKLWQGLVSLNASTVELAVTQGQSLQLIKALLDQPELCDFHATPSRNRMRLLSNTTNVDDPGYVQVVDWVTHFLFSGDSSIILANATAEYNHLVRRIPYEDLVAKKLKKELKEKFDPSGVLNPFVVL